MSTEIRVNGMTLKLLNDGTLSIGGDFPKVIRFEDCGVPCVIGPDIEYNVTEMLTATCRKAISDARESSFAFKARK